MRGRLDRWLLVAIGALSLAGLVVLALAAAPPPSDKEEHAGSTEIAGPDGAKALFEYLERVGLHPSRTVTQDLATPPGAVLVLIASGLERSEVDPLIERVRKGQTLLVASDDPTDAIWDALGLVLVSGGSAGRAEVQWPSPAVTGVARVEAEGAMRIQIGGEGAAAAAVPGRTNNPGAGWATLLGDDAGAVAAIRKIGAGEVIVVSDPALLSNEGLPRADDLKFADAALRHLAGANGEIVFDEFHHGYGVERTVSGWFARAGLLPALWLAAIALLLEGGRRLFARLGPPRPPPEPERRAIREFVFSYAGLLRASGHRVHAVRALDRTLRRRLKDQLGIATSTPAKDVFRLLTQRAPKAAARAYRALERAPELLDDPEGVSERDVLALARDVRAVEAVLRRS